MSKFIIIDNSIQNIAGHHYQYAAHCLKAANELGYETFLATNKAYSSSEEPDWKVFPVYSYGFWGGGTDKFLIRALVSIDRNLSTSVSKLKCRAIFSRMGLSWEIRKQLFNYTSMPGEVIIRHPSVWILLSSIAVVPVITSMRLARYISKLKRSVLFLSSSKKIDPITGVTIDNTVSAEFAKNTRRLFKRVKLERDDIVFIPTVGINELFGLLEYFKRAVDSKNATWHLLFRRNIFSGREHEYWKEDESLRMIRNVLINFTQNLSGQSTYFYTDTGELSGQYNRLGKIPFHTLPIPHTVQPLSKPIEKLPLTITYIGDARTEKGYHYLPHIIDDLWSKYIEKDIVRFVLQSNFNIPKGEPKAKVARSQLEHYPNDKVTLIYEPLPFDEYIKLLLSSDIVLLPYDEDKYYARSSGILVECLCAGIPVLVPAATWLSRQFINEIYNHHEFLYMNMRVNKFRLGNDIPWHRYGTGANPFVNGELIFGGNATKAFCWLENTWGAMFIRISFTIKGSPLSSVRVEIAQLRTDLTEAKFTSTLVEKGNAGACSVLIPIEKDCHRLWVGFKNAFGNSAMRISGISIASLQATQKLEHYPRSAVGLTYDNPSEISELLFEMIDNYSHYRKSALCFANEYSQFHNARNLVDEIRNLSNFNKNATKNELTQ